MASRWLEGNGFIFRPGDGGTDFGIDAEIEFSGATTTGFLVKCQIKGSRHINFTKSGTVKIRGIKVTTRNQWAALRLPVVALLVDTQTDKIYWTLPEKVFDPKATDLVFQEEKCANDAPDEFRSALWRAVQKPADLGTLDDVIGFLRLYEELRPEVGYMDPQFSVEPHRHMTLR